MKMNNYKGGFNPNTNRKPYNPPRNDAPVVQPVTAAELPADYVDRAEQVISGMFQSQLKITSTKIRKLFGLYTDLYNDVRHSAADALTPEQKQELSAARVRTVYECGRDRNNNVYDFVRTAKLLEYLKGIGGSREKFQNFYRYFEALVAYHRYYFGDK